MFHKPNFDIKIYKIETLNLTLRKIDFTQFSKIFFINVLTITVIAETNLSNVL